MMKSMPGMGCWCGLASCYPVGRVGSALVLSRLLMLILLTASVNTLAR